MRTTADSAQEYLRARTRAATVTDPRILDLRATIAKWETEVSRLVVENAALRRERDTLNTLLDGSLAREREADRAVRELLALINGTPRGIVWMLWDRIIGRGSR
jgi:hypothetical protein